VPGDVLVVSILGSSALRFRPRHDQAVPQLLLVGSQQTLPWGTWCRTSIVLNVVHAIGDRLVGRAHGAQMEYGDILFDLLTLGDYSGQYASGDAA
jgi:hypothetical protein